MMFNTRLKEENRQLRNRIYELEQILCPCEQHDLVQIGREMCFGSSPADIDYIYTYQCKRCKKIVRKREYM